MSNNFYLPKIFSDHMVLQQGQKIPVWGWANPGTRVEVQLLRTKRSAVAGRDGYWRIDLPRRKAGGPYQLIVRGSQTMTFEDVMVGEVWLCSGQSNMFWPMSETDGALQLRQTDVGQGLRIFRIEADQSPKPLFDLNFTDGWQAATASTLADFSAVAYWFGKNLHEEKGVTIGLVQNAVRGSRIEAWISREALAVFPGFDALFDDMPQSYQNLASRYEYEQNQYLKDLRLWRSMIEKADLGKKEHWQSSDLDTMAWNTTEVPATWQDAYFPLRTGVVWYRKDFTLDKKQRDKFSRLQLGQIGEQDITYLNGKRIGGTKSDNALRDYRLTEDTLREGKNTLVVRVMNYEGPGGFLSDADRLGLDANQSTSVNFMSLAGDWEYRVGVDVDELLPMPMPPEGHRSDPSVLHNALLAPLQPYGIRGFLWYQGEQNTDYPAMYSQLFPALIADWRARWQQPELPFIYAQLPNFGAMDAAPVQSQWAALRDVQRKTLRLTEKTAMAVLIDIGETNNIHPYNKRDVGYRLAQEALRVAYKQKDRHGTGPLINHAEIFDQQVRLHFDFVGDGLTIAAGDSTLRGFSLAGEDGVFHWVQAIIDGESVLLSTAKVPEPLIVRYGWADNPPQNLRNLSGLPASPFEEKIHDQEQ